MATNDSMGYQNGIMVAVLGAIRNGPLLRTPLARKADVQYETLQRYLDYFLSNGIVEELADKSIKITEKGVTFLQPLEQAMAVVNKGTGAQ